MNNDCGVDLVDRALYETVHDYVDPVSKQKGVGALAIRMNMNAGTLQNKANPTQLDHVFNKKEIEQLILHTHDFRYLYAINEKFNHETIYLGSYDDVSDTALIECLAKIDIERGEFMTELRNALAQGEVSFDEYNILNKEGMDVVRAWLEALERLKGMRVNKFAKPNLVSADQKIS